MATATLSLTKRALLIGNNNYDIDKLQRCSNDAKDVAKKLETIGFEIKVYVNLIHQDMIDKINDFIEKIVETDIVVFFFSGHGTEWQDKNYLIPIDNTRLSERPDRHANFAVPAQAILESMKKKKPFSIVFLLDCCRVHIEGIKAISIPSDPTGFTMIKGVAGSLIVFACGPDEKTFDRSRNDRNSLFTYHLLEHIAEPNLKLEEMMCRVCDGVYEDSAGQLYTYRISSLRTSNIYFNSTKKGMTF
jgi:uncharacterized caspase-like protein